MNQYTHRELTLNHYKIYLKIYGSMLMYLAEDDSEVIKIINNEELDSILKAVRERIEDSLLYSYTF